MPRKKNRSKDSIAQIEDFLRAGSPFRLEHKEVSSDFVGTILILDTSKLFSQRSILLQKSNDDHFDVTVFLSKMEQYLNKDDICRTTNGQLLLVRLFGVLKQQKLSKLLREAFERFSSAISFGKPNTGPTSTIYSDYLDFTYLHIDAATFYDACMNINAGQKADQKTRIAREDTTGWPTAIATHSYGDSSSQFVSLKLTQVEIARETLIRANAEKRHAEEQLYNLLVLGVSGREATLSEVREWCRRSSKEESGLTLYHSDEIKRTVEFFEQKFGVSLQTMDGAGDNSPIAEMLSKRQAFVASVQDEFLKNTGIEGQSLSEFARRISSILTSSGILLCRESLANGGFLSIESDGTGVFLRDIALNKRKRIEKLPHLMVSTVENHDTPKLRNQIASTTIHLLPDSQVVTMKETEFFEYFDLVLAHVSIKELSRQFQRWLDNFPEELRDFNKSRDKKISFARGVNSRAKSIGCRFSCGKKGCGMPSGLSVTAYGGATSGMFLFSHETSNGRMSHSKSTRLPRLQLVSG